MAVETKTCPKCKLEIPADASVCGHCSNQLVTPGNVIEWLVKALLIMAIIFGLAYLFVVR